MSTATHEPSAATDRDAQGRYQTGNGGGPGNPYARRVAELRRAMLNAVSAEDIQAILQELVARARRGDVQAAKLVLSYILGKPEPMADPDRVDAHEWALQKETATMYLEMPQVVEAPPAEVPLTTARAMRPAVGMVMRQQLAEMLTPRDESTTPAAESEGSKPSPNGILDILRERRASVPSANGKKASRRGK